MASWGRDSSPTSVRCSPTRGRPWPSDVDLDGLLAFAERSRLEDGGFGYLGDDGRVLPDRPVETWIVARMTHVFGLAALLGRESATDFVRHGVHALTDGPLHDLRNGGWYASTEDASKTAYV